MRFLRNKLLQASCFIAILITAFSGCGQKGLDKNPAEIPGNPAVTTDRINGIRILSPENDQLFSIGEQIPVKLEKITDTLPEIDSIELFMDGKIQFTSYGEPYEFSFEHAGGSVGSQTLRFLGYYRDGRKEYHNLNLIFKSDITPGFIQYRILNSRPHDVAAYTQGLIFEDGFLYEGTGQWTESSLRQIEIKTGEPLRMLNLPNDIFGEGITILNNKIYQLTYKSQVGFVYEKESFKRIQKVYYENREGWGLTHNGENLIMSDGSHRIYFLDAEYFTEIRQLEVYDNNGPVSRLNELEYIEGRIFANIYGAEEIIIIDPETGRVTGKLNMQGLLKEEEKHRRIDVFNGIAWDSENQILFVTGKYWPKLFEVRLQEPIP